VEADSRGSFGRMLAKLGRQVGTRSVEFAEGSDWVDPGIPSSTTGSVLLSRLSRFLSISAWDELSKSLVGIIGMLQGADDGEQLA